MWNLKYDTNEPVHESETSLWALRADMCLSRARELGGMEQEFGASRCKLLFTEWMNSKVLLYSAEN